MTLALRYAVRSDVGLLREGNEDSAYAGPAPAGGGRRHGRPRRRRGRQRRGHLALLPTSTTTCPPATCSTRSPTRSPGPTTRCTTWSPPTPRSGAWAPRSPPCSGPAAGWPCATSATPAPTCCRAASSSRSPTTTRWSSRWWTTAGSARTRCATHPQRSLLLRALDGRRRRRAGPVAARGPGSGTGTCCAPTACPAWSARKPCTGRWPPSRNLDDAVLQLVELAIKGGGPDNITCIVADVVDSATAVLPPSDVSVMAGAASNGSGGPPLAHRQPGRARPRAHPDRPAGRRGDRPRRSRPRARRSEPEDRVPSTGGAGCRSSSRCWCSWSS